MRLVWLMLFVISMGGGAYYAVHRPTPVDPISLDESIPVAGPGAAPDPAFAGIPDAPAIQNPLNQGPAGTAGLPLSPAPEPGGIPSKRDDTVGLPYPPAAQQQRQDDPPRDSFPPPSPDVGNIPPNPGQEYYPPPPVPPDAVGSFDGYGYPQGPSFEDEDFVPSLTPTPPQTGQTPFPDPYKGED